MDDSNSSSTTHLLSQSISEHSQKSVETSFNEGNMEAAREPRQRRVASVGEAVSC